MNLQHQESTSPLRSERGQIAIFIALIFQVLFVFFAMIVNIGLIVHDKINLQNSVDLAAYYGAQRQAEILNAIAHENYKIRQAWKLLSWRIRVIGDLGYKQHPMQENINAIPEEKAAFSSGQANSNAGSNWRPAVCVNHTLWGSDQQNFCQKSNISIPAMPSGLDKLVAPFGVLGAFNIGSAIATDVFRGNANKDCKDTGIINFNLALRWIMAYRSQVAESKELIKIYTQLLNDPYDFRDLSGNTVKGGALKTLDRNLTRANAKSLSEEASNFRFFNSLGGIPRDQWLNEVPIYPLVFYTDFISGGGGGCNGITRPINGLGTDNLPHHNKNINADMQKFRNEPSNPYDPYHSTFGYEKNPWMMAYVGVYAETKPRKPYLPFGEPITLRAKAFAKPFGGRIGPWFFKKWPAGSYRSSGNSLDKIDGRMPMPLDPDGKAMAASVGEQELAVPNYSRFPGDTLGLLSKRALTTFKKYINSEFKSGNKILPSHYTGTPTRSDGLAMPLRQEQMFSNLPGMRNLHLGYNGPWIRDVEVAAVAPDLFDITYYSIDLDSYKNYGEQLVRSRRVAEEKTPVDLGSYGTDEAGRRSIASQIDLLNQVQPENAFWVVRNPNHLLTAWAPSGAFDYSFPDQVFGNCYTGKSKESTPGLCARGGRVGYSVKIVSEDYLNSTELPLGGEGMVGKLSNPPPKDF